MTEVELSFLQRVPRTLNDISGSLERIAVALEKIAGSKSENTYVKKEIAIPRDEEPAEGDQPQHLIKECTPFPSKRVLNIFRIYNITTVEQVAKYSRHAYERIHALGAKSLNEIERMLIRHGYDFGKELRVQRQVEQ